MGISVPWETACSRARRDSQSKAGWCLGKHSARMSGADPTTWNHECMHGYGDGCTSAQVPVLPFRSPIISTSSEEKIPQNHRVSADIPPLSRIFRGHLACGRERCCSVSSDLPRPNSHPSNMLTPLLRVKKPRHNHPKSSPKPLTSEPKSRL